jgi:hypothetical protein
MINWDNVKMPKGVSQDEFLDQIYEICHIKAYQHDTKASVKFMSRDDLKQEFIMKCFRSLKSFDPTKSYDAEKGKWKLYFYRACDSMSLDIEKKYTYNRNVPCRTCPLFDKDKKSCTVYQQEEMDQCGPYKKYMHLQTSKFALGTMYGTGGKVECQQITSSQSREKEDLSSNVLDLFDYVENSCSVDVQRIFKDLCDVNYDTKQISKKDMAKIRKELKGKFDWRD